VTSASAASRTPSSLTTPLLERPQRPISNCGLTRTTAQAVAGGERECGRKRELQADEADIRNNELWRFGDECGVEIAGVDPLEPGHVGIGRDLRVHLTVADIDRVNPPGAPFQKDLGKAPRRGADVEADPAVR